MKAYLLENRWGDKEYYLNKETAITDFIDEVKDMVDREDDDVVAEFENYMDEDYIRNELDCEGCILIDACWYRDDPICLSVINIIE